MPKWGLTTSQRSRNPWGLSEELLLPWKTITDPVHGDIYLNKLETLLVDSPPMQRLRRVRQLGTTHLVYPGATHSRFSHALGTLRAAQNLLDAVWNSQTNPQAKNLRNDRLAEWREEGVAVLDEEFGKATVLARLGGLMHDLCHVPLGHTIEDDLHVLDAHDANVGRFDQLWAQLDDEARTAIERAPGLLDELRVLIISKDEHARGHSSAYPFVQDIVGNTICADLIDYIQRDHHNTGLPLALGHRFLDSFFVVESTHPYYSGRMVINVDREGRQRQDIVTELVKYLRYRYELTERVLTHHAKTAADAMLGKMLELWHDDLWLEAARERLPGAGFDDKDALFELKAKVEAASASTRDAPAADAPSTKSITRVVKQEIENEFLLRSDDGILEHLAAPKARASARRQAAAALANDLLNRNLYKIIGHAGGPADQAIAERAWEKFAKDPEQRLRLEREAAAFAGLDHGWHVVVWLPNHKMRLKVADVLVHHEGAVAPLSKVELASRAIAEQHERLWAVTVYAPDHVRDDPYKADAILAHLGDRTALTFRRRDASVVPGPWDLVVDKILEEATAGTADRETLVDLAASQRDAGTTQPATFNGMLDTLRAIAFLGDVDRVGASDGSEEAGTGNQRDASDVDEPGTGDDPSNV
jgi:HD superfamily phosphohydrolase